MKGIHGEAAEHALLSGGHSAALELVLMITSVGVVGLFIFLAYYFYRKNSTAMGQIRQKFSWLHKVLFGKYFIDEFYGLVIVRPLVNFSLFLWKIFDVIIIDGLINGMATIIGDISTVLRPVQSGKVRSYATIFVIGVMVLIGYFVIR